MPVDEGNGIHIRKDFLLGRGELEVAASRRRSFGCLLSEGMQEQESIRDKAYRVVNAKYLDDFNNRKCQRSQTQREDKSFSGYWNSLSFTLCGFYSIHNICAHLLAMMKCSYLNFMKSVFWRNITISIAGNCGEWNWKCMRKGFNILLLIPPSSQLELFSLRVVEMMKWSWLEHVGISREIPSEFVNHKVMNVASLNPGKQIKKTQYCSQ